MITTLEYIIHESAGFDLLEEGNENPSSEAMYRVKSLK
jgi:hypothetical protein